MSFEHFTAQQVLYAFEQSRFIPAQGDFYPADRCACGLGAMYYVKSKGLRAPNLNEAANELGVSESYADIWSCGFDQENINEIIRRYDDKADEAYIREVYNEGEAAWIAVKHLIPKET